MDQPVAEGNDPATVANTVGKVRVQPEGLTNPDFSRRLDVLRRLPEGRGFSPAEIAAPAFCWSRAPRSLQPQAARGTGHRNDQEGLVTAGLKPRPSKPVVRNAG